MIVFEPSKQFATVEEAIREAVDKATSTGDTYSFDCNGCLLVIDSRSDAAKLLSKYREFKHNEGVANGTILTASFKIP